MEKKLIENMLSENQVFSGKFIRVREDKVQLPNGRESTREFILHPGAVAVVPLLKDGRIVLVKQYRYPIQQALWEIPAGKLEYAEDPEACAKRELQEETGYVCKDLVKLVSTFTTPGFTNELIHIYLAKDLQKGEQSLDEDEFIQVMSYSREEIRSMIDNGIISDAKTLLGLLLAGI